MNRSTVGKIGFCSLGILIWLGTSGCHPKSPTDSSILRRGLAGEPSTLDPGLAVDSYSSSVLIDLYEGLTTTSPSGEVVPGVADSWTVDSTGTKYTFQLRMDARWSNGEKVIAQDFVNSWRREVDPKFGAPGADDLRIIANASEILAGKKPSEFLGVSATSDRLLLVTLDRPAVYFPQILTHPSTYPVYLKGAVNPDTHDPSTWVSNGPYILSAWVPTTRCDLKRNDVYWGRTHVHIKQVRYEFMPNEATQYAAYRAGELDMTDIVPVNVLPALRRQAPTELLITPFLATAYYGINLSNKTLANVSLRQALAMAIDRKRLVESLGFGQLPAYSFVPPGTAEYTPQQWSWEALSDDARESRAKALYRDAGFSKEKPLHLRVLFNSNEVIHRTAVLIAAMWKDVLGIDVELNAEEYKVFLQSRHDTSRWDLARLAWTADFDDASNFLDVLRTHSPNNDMSYANSTFDAQLDESALLLNNQQRISALETAERTMLNDYPIIPLYHYVSKRLVKPYLHGVSPNPLNYVPSKALWF